MSWIQTHSGQQFIPAALNPDAIRISDIAQALSMLCRFNGHTRRFYSVAEHCIVMSQMVAPEHAYEALMHDAAEAYIGDLARPLKPFVRGFKEMEERIMDVIREKYEVPGPTPAVKEADVRMLVTEQQQLMGEPPVPWETDGAEPYDVMLACHSPSEELARMFCRRFLELTPEHIAYDFSIQ